MEVVNSEGKVVDKVAPDEFSGISAFENRNIVTREDFPRIRPEYLFLAERSTEWDLIHSDPQALNYIGDVMGVEKFKSVFRPHFFTLGVSLRELAELVETYDWPILGLAERYGAQTWQKLEDYAELIQSIRDLFPYQNDLAKTQLYDVFCQMTPTKLQFGQSYVLPVLELLGQREREFALETISDELLRKDPDGVLDLYKHYASRATLLLERYAKDHSQTAISFLKDYSWFFDEAYSLLSSVDQQDHFDRVPAFLSREKIEQHAPQIIDLLEENIENDPLGVLCGFSNVSSLPHAWIRAMGVYTHINLGGSLKGISEGLRDRAAAFALRVAKNTGGRTSDAYARLRETRCPNILSDRELQEGIIDWAERYRINLPSLLGANRVNNLTHEVALDTFTDFDRELLHRASAYQIMSYAGEGAGEIFESIPMVEWRSTAIPLTERYREAAGREYNFGKMYRSNQTNQVVRDDNTREFGIYNFYRYITPIDVCASVCSDELMEHNLQNLDPHVRQDREISLLSFGRADQPNCLAPRGEFFERMSNRYKTFIAEPLDADAISAQIERIGSLHGWSRGRAVKGIKNLLFFQHGWPEGFLFSYSVSPNGVHSKPMIDLRPNALTVYHRSLIEKWAPYLDPQVRIILDPCSNAQGYPEALNLARVIKEALPFARVIACRVPHRAGNAHYDGNGDLRGWSFDSEEPWKTVRL